jgi:hypothetical protein
MAEEGAKALADELDACKDDDELESLLIARRWNVATIEHYLENFGKGQVHGTRSG